MSRKPMHLEMTGGKSPRQRMWEAMRKHRDGFDGDLLCRRAKVTASMARDYARCLLAGDFLEVISEERVNALCARRTYKLVKDVGVEAPRLTKEGKEVLQGSANDAMWGTLRRMFKVHATDYRELAAFASTPSCTISEGTAKAYMLTLAAAGYLECMVAPVLGRRPVPGRYRLLPGMDSGRRSPMIQRTKSVFDPNWNKVVWTESAEAGDE